MASRQKALFNVLTAAVADFTANGYDSEERVAYWSARIRRAAEQDGASDAEVDRMARDHLGTAYRRLVDRGELLKAHGGVSRFTLDNVRPQLRAELERRIRASANLIKLNRNDAIAKTLQRFQGWATSVPKGGSDATHKGETKVEIRKAMQQLPFASRRVLIDQGHKLVASVSEVVAQGGGAIALIWRSHWRQAGYNYRPDHKERDGKVYLMRGSWAAERGLVKSGAAGYYDAVTAVAVEPFCRCQAQYLYALRDLPEDMVTERGREELERVRAQIQGIK